MVKQRRQVTISGLSGFVPLTEPELKGYRIEIYFTATNVSDKNYYNYEWFKPQSLYGRFTVLRGEYTITSHLCRYEDEFIYTEDATLFEIVKRMQCDTQKLYSLIREVGEIAVGISNSPAIDTPNSTFPDTVPPLKIAVPGLLVDGIRYNMLPGCAGYLYIDSWVDDDVCVDLNGDPLTSDGHGNPPAPAAGSPAVGSPTDVPPPDYPSGGQPTTKPPSTYDPSQLLPNPGALQGQSCTMYRVRYYPTIDGNVGDTQTLTLPGKIGQPGSRQAVGADGQPIPGLVNYYIPYGIGCNQPGKTEDKYGVVGAGTQTQVTITIVSVVPVA